MRVRMLVPLLLVAVGCVLLLAAPAALDDGRQRPAARADPAPVPSRAAALRLLADWDRRRAAAWASGDLAALARLYVPGTPAGEHDRRMLRRWVDRGLRVRGLQVQVVSARTEERTRDRVVVVVTDRVRGGHAVGPTVGAPAGVPLPADGLTTRRVTLVRAAGQWQVAEVV